VIEPPFLTGSVPTTGTTASILEATPGALLGAVTANATAFDTRQEVTTACPTRQPPEIRHARSPQRSAENLRDVGVPCERCAVARAPLDVKVWGCSPDLLLFVCLAPLVGGRLRHQPAVGRIPGIGGSVPAVSGWISGSPTSRRKWISGWSVATSASHTFAIPNFAFAAQFFTPLTAWYVIGSQSFTIDNIFNENGGSFGANDLLRTLTHVALWRPDPDQIAQDPVIGSASVGCRRISAGIFACAMSCGQFECKASRRRAEFSGRLRRLLTEQHNRRFVAVIPPAIQRVCPLQFASASGDRTLSARAEAVCLPTRCARGQP
jgi:hypothetical protein